MGKPLQVTLVAWPFLRPVHCGPLEYFYCRPHLLSSAERAQALVAADTLERQLYCISF